MPENVQNFKLRNETPVSARHRFFLFRSMKTVFFFLICLQLSLVTTVCAADGRLDSKGNRAGQIFLKNGQTVKYVMAAADVSSAAAVQNLNSADSDKAQELFMDGIDALGDEDFEEARRLFQQAVVLNSQNLEYRYFLGVALVRLKKNREALAIFESLVQEDPKAYFKACFDMAAIYSSQKQYEKALESLRVAEKIDPKSGRVYMDMGYAYKDMKNYDMALKSFERARELDSSLEQIAIYMTAVVYLEDEQFGEAEKMFQKTVDVNPDTPLASSAEETLPRIEAAAWARKPWYLITDFTWGYDDNVARDPLGEITGGPMTGGLGKGDQFQTFYLKGGYKFLNQKQYEAGVGYTLFSLGYRDWTNSNVTSHSPHAYFQADWNPVFFRFQYDFSYFYSGGEKQEINPPIYLTFANNSYARLRMHSFMPTISIIEPYDLRTDINLGYQIKDYLDGVTGDSSRYAGDITQSYKIPGIQCFPRIGYRTAFEKSGDDPSTYRYHELMAGISSVLYWDIWGDLSFSYMRTDYPDFTPKESRKDKTYTTVFSLRRNFLERLLLSFTYMHLRNDSDYLQDGKDYYTFRKNIYMMEITYTF